MLDKLLAVLRLPHTPDTRLGDNFNAMIRSSRELCERARLVYFGDSPDIDPAELERDDVKINKFERKIRKRVLLYLSAQNNAPDLPYCLVLISLIKDVERIGDYAKDLAAAASQRPSPSTASAESARLEELAKEIEAILERTPSVFDESDYEEAQASIRAGKRIVAACETLHESLSQLDAPAAEIVSLTLATQYYKRIAGHILNVLSSVVVPLHRLDYYDEKDMLKQGEADSQSALSS